nr:SBBP repeat-containing protein [Chitinophagaceae bacterium]
MKQLLKIFFLYLLFFCYGVLHSQTYQWAKNIGGGGEDLASTIYTDNNGFVYVTGFFSGNNVDFDPSLTATAYLSSKGNKDGFVAKYTTTGQYVWAFSIGGSSQDKAESVTVDILGNVFVTGFFRGNNVDFDPSLSNTAILNSNGDAGGDPGYGGDIFVAKYNSSGQYQWAFNVGGASIGDAGLAIVCDNLSNVYVSGYFRESPDFNPSPSLSNILNASAGTLFIAKYNSLGQYQWAFNIGQGNVDNAPFGMKIDALANIYITGYFQGINRDFNPSSSASNTLTSNGGFDAFVVTTVSVFVCLGSVLLADAALRSY